MKHLKKIYSSFITLIVITISIFTLSACGNQNNNNNNQCQHQWVEADCLYPKTCRLCGETDGEALGHTEVIDDAVEATCTSTGLTEGKHCSVCNKIIIAQSTTPKTGHEWGNPTCTTPRSCIVCFEVDETSKPLGHSFVNGECSVCGEDDPEYITLTLTASSYDIHLENGSYIVYITMTGGESVVCEVDDSYIVSCEWGEWDEDIIPLKFTPVSSGNTYVTVTVEGYDKSIRIDVSVETIDIKLQQMSALGIDTAYNSAKYPSTLRLSRVTYEDMVNGYGDSITRMVIRCYATNSFGGYGDIYVIVLCCEYETDYIDYELNGLYFSVSAYDSSPGECDNILDNAIAMNAYKNLIDNPKEIPYD